MLTSPFAVGQKEESMAIHCLHPCPQCGTPIGVCMHPDGSIEYTNRVAVCNCILTDVEYEAERVWALVQRALDEQD